MAATRPFVVRQNIDDSRPFLEIKVNFALSSIGHVPSSTTGSVQQGETLSRSDPGEETAEHKPDQTGSLQIRRLTCLILQRVGSLKNNVVRV